MSRRAHRRIEGAVGPSDTVPASSVAEAVALADKLDMLVGFWLIDEKPTGSKDPYALRRAALGVIRILLERSRRLGLLPVIAKSMELYPAAVPDRISVARTLLEFFADRLKVYLRDKGARHDLIDAVFSIGSEDDLLMLVRRVEALARFLTTDDGRNLLAGVRRATSIIRIEEAKDKLEDELVRAAHIATKPTKTSAAPTPAHQQQTTPPPPQP